MNAHRLLVVVDMQRDFLTGSLPAAGAQGILPRVAARIRSARECGETVVFTRDTHGAEYLETQEGRNLPVEHCIAGTPGWEIDPSLPVGNAKIFDKPGFGSVALGKFAAAQGCTDIELIGVCTDICVLSNAVLLKAFCPEARLSVRADCCAGVTPERHALALEAMKACQIEIL